MRADRAGRYRARSSPSLTSCLGLHGERRLNSRLPIPMQRPRHPSRLPNLDRIRLRIVLRCHRKTGMPKRACDIVRRGPSFERQRRVQTAKGVRTDSSYLCFIAVGMQSLVHPVWRGLLVSVRCENPLAKGSLRTVLGQQFRDGSEQFQPTLRILVLGPVHKDVDSDHCSHRQPEDFRGSQAEIELHQNREGSFFAILTAPSSSIR